MRWSETRFYMACVMGASMAVIMLLFMLGMYKSKVVNASILMAAVVVFAGALWLVRSQTTVQDRSYTRAMIPHHSIAVLTSERSELTDLRVLELADENIIAQRREIAEMGWLIDDIAENGEVTTEAERGFPRPFHVSSVRIPSSVQAEVNGEVGQIDAGPKCFDGCGRRYIG